MTDARLDLSDRLDFTVDPDAAPTDVDEALAVFLLAFVREEGLDKLAEGSDQ